MSDDAPHHRRRLLSITSLFWAFSEFGRPVVDESAQDLTDLPRAQILSALAGDFLSIVRQVLSCVQTDKTAGHEDYIV